MSNKKKNLSLPEDLQSVDPVRVKGLTIREIRHRRAVTLLQKEFCKEKLQFGVLKLKNESPFSKGYQAKPGGMGKTMAIVSKLVGGMNYLDYALIGFSLFSNIKKAIKVFKKK